MALKGLDENKNGFTFYWKIKHFSLWALSKFGKIVSPVFRIHQFDKTEWVLCMNFAFNDDKATYFSVSRETSDEGPSEIYFDIKLFLMFMDGWKVIGETVNKRFTKNINRYEGLTQCRLISELFLPDDILTVRCFIKKYSVDAVESTECTAYTEMLTEKISFEIPFSVSQPFKADTLLHTSVSKKYPNFKINLQPSCSPHGTPSILVKIEMARSTFEVFAKCKLSVVDTKSETVFVIDGRHKFKPNTDDQAWDLTKSVSSNEFKTSNLDSGFILLCELVVSDGKYSSGIQNLAFSYPASSVKPNIPTSYSLKDKLRRLHAVSRLCDFTLQVDGNNFQVHKAVLGAVSPVFCAMFELEMKERENSVSVVKDIDAGTVRKLIDFAYSERVEDLQWESALKLYSAADRYQIPELQELCAKYLTDNLTIDNCTEVLTISDMHQDSNLEKAAGNFVFVHAKEIFKSDNWKTFTGSNVTSANKILQEICNKFVIIHNN